MREVKMQDTKNVKYPYARLTGMTQFMNFVREPGWKPDVITVDLLKKLDMAPSKERETVYTLKFLGLVADDGVPTEQFDNLKQDYQDTLKKLVLEKYGQLFRLLPANMINQARLVKFFGLSADTSEYQAKLFAWLCEQAGIKLPNLEKHLRRSRHDKKKTPVT